jgi:hypothetical protein
MKYRIAKVESEHPYFILQIKKWYGWRTYQDGGVDDIGIYSYDRRFQSVEEVEAFITNHLTKPKLSIIKEW